MSDALIAPVDDTVDAIDEIDVDAALQAEPEDIDTEAVDDAPEEVADDAPAPDAPVAEAAPEPDPVEPFAFKAFGQPYEVPGLTWNPKAKTITVENDRAFERVRQMLSHGREWEARGRQELVELRKQNEQIRNTPNPDVEAARVYLEEWQKMMAMDPDALWQFVQNARTEWPKIEARAERSYAERLYQQAQAAQQPPEPDVHEIAEEAKHWAAELVRDITRDQPWATPEVQADLIEFVQDMDTLNQVVGRARESNPDEGLQAGQYFLNRDKLSKLVERQVKPYRNAHGAQATAAKQLQTTQTVATRNAAALSRAKPNTPAAPKAATPSTSRPRPQDVVSDAMKVWREMQR